MVHKWWKNNEVRAFLGGLVLPALILSLGLKIWRVAHRGEWSAWWAVPDLVRSDFFVVVGFSLLGVALLTTVSESLRARVLLGLQFFVVPWAVLEVVAHHFFMVTGSTFDLHLLFFSMGRVGETAAVIASEVPLWAWVFLGAVTLVFAGIPWLLRRFLTGSEERGAPPRPWALAAAAVVCVGLAVPPAVREDYVSFGRANFLNLAWSLKDVQVMEVEEVRRQSLVQTRLMERGQGIEKERNLVVVILESTRARSMTVHNPELDTTPFLAELATKSLVADRAYTVVPHTSKALVAILCGIEPRLRMPITEALPEGIPARCLADLLGDEGYRSVFLQSATERFEDRPGLVDNMGFEDFIPLELMERQGFEQANYFGKEDLVMLEPARQWLEDLKNSGDAPFFVTYLTLTPHHDYLAPQRFGRIQFVEDDELNRYKNTLYYVDHFSRKVIEKYQELGLYEDTIFVFVGDHGEGFNEHGRNQHDNVIWEEGIHIPLMIYDPQRPEGRRVHYPVSQIDLAPTLLEMLGFRLDGGEYPGRLLWESDEDRTVYAHCWYERRCMARVGHRYKYIDHFGRHRAEVYDLLEDPLETRNLLSSQGDLVRQWRAVLYGWRQGVNDLYRREQRDRVQEYIFEELPEGVVPLEFELGEFARFLGYELDRESARGGQRVTATYYFEVLKPIDEGWRLFTHGESRGRMTNLDHIPVMGLHPLDEWEVGTIVADEHTFRIPRDWQGTFALYLGIYHRDEGRVEVRGEVETDGNRRAKIFELPLR